MLDALWLSRNPWPGSAHEDVLKSARLDGSGFLAWVSDVLEAGQFTPEDAGHAPVVITPLVRAMLRPFGALVLPGADADTLGRPGRSLSLLSDADAAALGLPTQARQREAEAQAFSQALRAPALTLLRCTRAGAEPLSPSPLIERLVAAARRAGRESPLQPWVDERQPVLIAPQPVLRGCCGVAPFLWRCVLVIARAFGLHGNPDRFAARSARAEVSPMRLSGCRGRTRGLCFNMPAARRRVAGHGLVLPVAPPAPWCRWLTWPRGPAVCHTGGHATFSLSV